MLELSIFIDESGDFGEIKKRPAYYLVTLLFHEQKHNISEYVQHLEDSVLSSKNIRTISFLLIKSLFIMIMAK